MTLKTLKPRLQTIKSTMPTQVPGSWRNSGMTTNERGYDHRWKQARLGFLRANPLCEMCLAENKATPATLIDHRIPHRGNKVLFWQVDNWAALCAHCHSSVKQREENAMR